jgi:RNA polymerase primary sigma factor
LKNQGDTQKNQMVRAKEARSSLDFYLKEIGKFKLISREREVVLAAKIKLGDQGALDELVKANLRFVVSVAKRYQNQGVLLADLINEGNVGLVKAAKRFDASRGFVFISYAVWWIRQAILKALAEQSRILRVPLNRAGDKHTVNEVSQKLLHSFDREPSVEEIAAATKMTEAEILATYQVRDSHVSLEMFFDGESDGSAMDTIADDHAVLAPIALEQEELRNIIRSLLYTLPSRDAEIFMLYFGLNGEGPLTLEEIGERYNLSRERTRQIKKIILKWFQHPLRAKLLQDFLQKDRTF